MMIDGQSAVGGAALKEWASAIAALEEGRQIILMRKGGIAEETRDFRLASPRFWLLPTYEHQREHLLKETYRELVGRSMRDWGGPDGDIRITAWAEAVRDLEVSNQETLDKLREHHIWTDAFAEERLKWKRKQPLHVLVVRVHRLREPAVIPMRESYIGCKSWVRLESALPEMAPNPVLPDERFAEQVRMIEQLLQ